MSDDAPAAPVIDIYKGHLWGTFVRDICKGHLKGTFVAMCCRVCEWHVLPCERNANRSDDAPAAPVQVICKGHVLQRVAVCVVTCVAVCVIDMCCRVRGTQTGATTLQQHLYMIFVSNMCCSVLQCVWVTCVAVWEVHKHERRRSSSTYECHSWHMWVICVAVCCSTWDSHVSTSSMLHQLHCFGTLRSPVAVCCSVTFENDMCCSVLPCVCVTYVAVCVRDM